LVCVQVDSGAGSADSPEVSQRHGIVGNRQYGLFVTLGTLTAQAKSFGASRSNFYLLDGNNLVELISRCYEQFDGPYKAVAPLNRILIPEVLAE
jgi:restriction system protein